jgi:2-dehydropantoate 2-reductase
MFDHRKRNILVVGAGGVGAYFGGRLARSGKADVSVVCRSDYEAVREHGYRVESIAGDFDFMPSAVYRCPEECTAEMDLVIVTTKVLPGTDTPALIRPVVRKNTAILLIQNGLGMEEEVAAAYPDNLLLGAIAYIGVFRSGGGRIVHKGGGTLAIGQYPTGDAPLLDWLVRTWNDAGVGTRKSADIILDRWAKLVWNAPYNPVSVLGGCLDTGMICADALLDELCGDLMREVCAAARACGKELPSGIVEKNLNYTHNFPAYKTSMLLDFENKRPLEVEAILGAIVDRAHEKGAEIPRLRTIYALLRSVNRRNLADHGQ